MQHPLFVVLTWQWLAIRSITGIFIFGARKKPQSHVGWAMLFQCRLRIALSLFLLRSTPLPPSHHRLCWDEFLCTSACDTGDSELYQHFRLSYLDGGRRIRGVTRVLQVIVFLIAKTMLIVKYTRDDRSSESERQSSSS